MHETERTISRAACEETGIHPEQVEAALDSMPSMDEVYGASELLKAVGDPTRMRILSALMGRELCVCDIQAVLGMSQSAVSHQLRVLRARDLVKYRREGKMAYYSLADQHVVNLLRMSLEHVRHSRQARV
ncbi:ArsR family transcriptional regulator [Rubrobacter taiwanensis]|jgi:DNA-binding transcriptional ArsR family regulator|uniref:ArsR family transcriptional regulator n=1 Tax=Rubrobacter taiwanensis TaxID=185139 RepID=A0A4R1BFP9_9ACTN|nr:metalloregulator ArsR/SmtB family transcription factor [Rubrobacter taiwanensis]TCJ16015.1 ArsR family transcriptional regulator [Rubrobacter taiwanensis]